MSWWTDRFPDTPEPKHYTRRNSARKTHGWRVAEISAALGYPLMPWQRYVADVALEYDEHGHYVYEDVIVTVPRQSGKTTLVGPVQLDRVMFQKDIQVFYTAQTQKDARQRFEELVKLVQKSPFRSVARFRWSGGSERITFPSGSSINLFAPKQDALHGGHPPLVTMDEIWALDEATGRAIYDDAIKPAQFTLAGNRQRWQISTAGTAESTYMRRLVELGRKGAPGFAFFEWSMPDGLDPYAPASIEAFHPAVGHTATVADVFATAGRNADGTINVQLKADDVMPHAKYMRSMCNVWTETTNALVPDDIWNSERRDDDTHPVPSRAALALSYEVAHGNGSGVVMASWRDPDGAPCSRVVHAAPGTTWMVPLLLQLRDEWSPAVIAADDGGPTRRITDELAARVGGIDRLHVLGGKDSSTAAEAWVTYVRDDRTFRHDGSATLTGGMRRLVLTRMGDATKFSRKDSPGSIAGPIASAVGLWAYDHKPAPIGKPFIYIGDEDDL